MCSQYFSCDNKEFWFWKDSHRKILVFIINFRTQLRFLALHKFTSLKVVLRFFVVLEILFLVLKLIIITNFSVWILFFGSIHWFPIRDGKVWSVTENWITLREPTPLALRYNQRAWKVVSYIRRMIRSIHPNHVKT